jgi:hypothetical protein
VQILTSKYSGYHACRCAHKRMASCNAKTACTLIKLDSGLGSCSSPSSLLPHPRDQCATHKCLPFSPTAPPIFLTWLRCGIMGVTVLTVQAGYHYYTFKNIMWFHYIFSGMMVQVDHCYCTFQKHQFTFTVFLRNNHSMNIVGQDQEFCMTDVGKQHLKEWCIRCNCTLFIWVLSWDQRKLTIPVCICNAYGNDG